MGVPVTHTSCLELWEQVCHCQLCHCQGDLCREPGWVTGSPWVTSPEPVNARITAELCPALRRRIGCRMPQGSSAFQTPALLTLAAFLEPHPVDKCHHPSGPTIEASLCQKELAALRQSWAVTLGHRECCQSIFST